MSEFASGDAFHHPYGRPRNPWDLSRNPGTSSSGSGAATAACLCATSLGEDTGGSIRGPAAFCGLVGLRPSWGRVSRYGVFGACWSMDIVGPMSRTTADCAMTLGAIAGYDPKDPSTWHVPVPDYLAALSGDMRGLKVGVIRERVHTDAVEPEIQAAVLRAIAVLGELGASVVDVSIPLIVHSAVISNTIITTDAATLHRTTLQQRLAEYDHNNQVRLLVGSILPAQAYQKATRLRQMLRQQILAALEQVNVLVMPTSSIPASPIPERAGISSKQEVLDGLACRLPGEHLPRPPCCVSHMPTSRLLIGIRNGRRYSGCRPPLLAALYLVRCPVIASQSALSVCLERLTACPLCLAP
jgi:aspartyl-tRNA(Asn)/glutamyl-tRNA(Gln) amidotransferase subunit A